MPRPIFKGLVFAFTGPQEQPLDKVRNWIELRKGTVSDEFNDTVTHLITNQTQLSDKNNQQVKKALLLGSKNIVFVDWSWLAQSCDQERKLPHKPFCQFQSLKTKRKTDRANARNRQTKRLAENENWIDQGLFHIYTNADAFTYDILLTRPTDTGEEVYRLYIFESKASPRLYVTAVKFYKRKKGQDGVVRPAGVTKRHVLSKCLHGNRLAEAYERFAKFFELKTGYGWESRDEMVAVMNSGMFTYNSPSAKPQTKADERAPGDSCSNGDACSDGDGGNVTGTPELQPTQEEQGNIESSDLAVSFGNHMTEEA